MKKTLLIIYLVAFIVTIGYTQNQPIRCYTTEYMQHLHQEHPHLHSDEQFETWIAARMKALKARGMRRDATYEIPVVVHVIHEGEAVGVGNNISEAQILSQIRVLNEDFNRENIDADNTPGIFVSVASSISVEFKMAIRDPDGAQMAEPGINRVNASAEGWGEFPYSVDLMQLVVKPNTIWNPEEYLNIWVVPIEDGILGYAQFPEGSTLNGVPSPNFNETADTDGVVVLTESFGSNYDAAGELIADPYDLNVYDRGRTLTHEIGHFFGLRHVWGDSNCGNDFVSDTPTQLTSNGGCPSFPQSSCGNTSDMFMNYMDFTLDVCMNLFTQGQVDRMITVLDNSPRRTELLSSNVAEDIQPNGIYAAFRADRFTIEIGESINITELSFTGGNTSITSWSWNFDLDGEGGVSPSSFNGQNPPTITYNQVGVYRVRLTISNGSTTDERIAEINVLPQPPLDLAIVNSDLIIVDDIERVAKRVEFRWIDQSEEDAFQVIRQPISFEAPAVLVETLPANTTTYTDDNFTEEETSQGIVRFAYVVTSVKEGLQSASEVKIVDVRFDQAVTNIEEELSEEFQIYPNPSDGIFTIDLENIPARSVEAKVYNSLGQCVSTQTLTPSTKNYLNLESLEGGIYFLQVTTEERTWKTKIVIQ